MIHPGGLAYSSRLVSWDAARKSASERSAVFRAAPDLTTRLEEAASGLTSFSRTPTQQGVPEETFYEG